MWMENANNSQITVKEFEENQTETENIYNEFFFSIDDLNPRV